MENLRKNQKLVEIGASHSPLIPKRDGWNTCVVDHATRADLIVKYSYTDERAAVVEDVDVVWSGGPLHERFSASDQGTYDSIVASHVFEHMPNPIAFLRSCELLLKPQGRVVLALPDKRRCFDFFGNLSTTGDLLETYLHGQSTHTPRAAFNEVAYAVSNNGAIGWGACQPTTLEFVHPLDRALGCASRAHHFPSQYFDHHAWRFVPSSFALIILELTMLGYLGMRLEKLSAVNSQEFFVDLVKDRVVLASPSDLSARRMTLLKENLRSLALQLEEMGQ